MTAANHSWPSAEAANGEIPPGEEGEQKMITMDNQNNGHSQSHLRDRNNNKSEEKRNEEQNGIDLQNGQIRPTTSEFNGASATAAGKGDGNEEMKSKKNGWRNGNITGTKSRADDEQEGMTRFARYSKSHLESILPSTYVKRLLPSGLYRLCCYGAYLFWFTIGILVLRKTKFATSAMHYVKYHGPTVSLANIENSAEFADLLRQIDKDEKPPAILMLNQYALNMTFNFLCNTAIFPGAHNRFIFVTLDAKSRDVLKQYWPNIRQFHWPTPCLYKPFSFSDGPYQTIYLLRANLAIALIKRGKSFWMQQQDTFWRKNLFEIGLEQEPGYDLLFDQVGHGNNSKRAEWVNGANFFVRANEHTHQFFKAIADKLAHWYTPDMGIMIHQCHTWDRPICKFIPHRIANSWEWMYTNQQEPPHIMQLDCETDGGSKLQQLARFGFYFTQTDGRTCDPDAVHRAQLAMEAGRVDVGDGVGPVRLSWGRLQFKVYWWLVDYILCTPLIGPLLKPYLPLVGYILMVTLA